MRRPFAASLLFALVLVVLLACRAATMLAPEPAGELLPAEATAPAVITVTQPSSTPTADPAGEGQS